MYTAQDLLMNVPHSLRSSKHSKPQFGAWVGHKEMADPKWEKTVGFLRLISPTLIVSNALKFLFLTNLCSYMIRQK